MDLLDAIEARLSALRSRGELAAAPGEGPQTASALGAELRAAGISAGEFARLTRVPRDVVGAWTAGRSAAPEWVSAAVRLVALLTPSARHKLLNGAGRAHILPLDRTNTHPFSRIEDL